MPGDEREREKERARAIVCVREREGGKTKLVDLWRDAEAKKQANCPAIEKLVLLSVTFCFLGRCEAVQLWMQHVKQSMNLSPTQVN